MLETDTVQVNIIAFIQNTEEELSRFLMTEAMSTNVKVLMFDNHYIQHASAALRCDRLSRAVLKALDYLAVHEVVHRDIKPENIFANRRGNDYDYKLGDFGLAESIAFAKNDSGSHYFKAPETRFSRPQSPNADVYCLYATLAMVKDVQGYRRYALHESKRPGYPDLNNEDVIAFIEGTRKDPALVKWAKMAEQDPKKRPDAGDVLDEHFPDEGRAPVTQAVIYKRKVFAEICRPKYAVTISKWRSPPETREAAERKRKLEVMAMGADDPAQFDVTKLGNFDTNYGHCESETDHPNKKQRVGDPDPEVLKSLTDTQLARHIRAIVEVQQIRAAEAGSIIDTDFSKGFKPDSLSISEYAEAAERKRADALSSGDAPKLISKRAAPGKPNAKKFKSKKGSARSGLTSMLSSARV
jgi:serine/threonine protein kinase